MTAGGRRVSTIRGAAAFVRRVDLAVLFPRDGIALPSLWEQVAGPDQVPFVEWGPAESKVWEWKNELPARGLAWYGKLLWGRASLLSPALLADLYTGRGEPGDHRRFDLSADAMRVAEALDAGGAQPVPALRIGTGLDGKAGKARFDRAMNELFRQLLVTHCGVFEGDAGWPAAIIELTPRLFAVGQEPDRVSATKRWLATVPDGTPKELAKSFGWSVPEAVAALEGT